MILKKNILMISQGTFPPDIRLEKEIKSLETEENKKMFMDDLGIKV